MSQFAATLAKDSGAAMGTAAKYAGPLACVGAVSQYMAASASKAVASTGTFLGRYLGPVAIIAAIGYQVIQFKLYNFTKSAKRGIAIQYLVVIR